MIDIHSHIIPGVDDGSEDLDMSIEMAYLALESGIGTIIATPHCDAVNGDGVQNAAQMRSAVSSFRRELREREIPLEIYTGMEIFGTRSTAEYLDDGEYTTLADSRYPLIEFYFADYGVQATRILASVVEAGYTPIVAHPERYQYVCDEPQLLNLWTDMGCLLQVNRGSFFGRFGEQTQALAHGMLERGFVSFIASDAHSSEMRTPWLKDVADFLELEYSDDYAETILETNPMSVIRNRIITMDEPEWF